MDEKMQKGFHMMVNTSFLNLGLFISDVSVPLYVLSQGGSFLDVGWASALSFVCSGLGAIIFGTLGDRWGFGFIRFIVNIGIVLLYIVLVASTNVVSILVVYVIRGIVMQNVWVSIAYYSKSHHPQDALWFISTTLTLMYIAQVIGPFIAGVLIHVSDSRIALIVALGIFILVFFQSGHFAKCDAPTEDHMMDGNTNIAAIQDASGPTRPSVPSADLYREPVAEGSRTRTGTMSRTSYTTGDGGIGSPTGRPSDHELSFFDLSIARQFIIIFLVFLSGAGTIMTVLLMIWYVVLGEYIGRGGNVGNASQKTILVSVGQMSLFFLMAAIVSKFLPQMYASFSLNVRRNLDGDDDDGHGRNGSDGFLSGFCDGRGMFVHVSRIVIAIISVIQIIMLEAMSVRVRQKKSLDEPVVWIGMMTLGLLQGVMYVIPSALLTEYAPKHAAYSSFVKGMSAFFKRGLTAAGLLYVGIRFGSQKTVLFYVLQISLSFSPVLIVLMYLCDCFEDFGEEDGEDGRGQYQRVRGVAGDV